MAYYAEIDADNIVLRVIVIDDSQDAELGEVGIAKWIAGKDGLGLGGTWVKTYKDRSKRKNYAGKGFTFDAGRDAFIPPRPYPSWVLDEQTARYKPPVERPIDGGDYRWDEKSRSWRAEGPSRGKTSSV